MIFRGFGSNPIWTLLILPEVAPYTRRFAAVLYILFAPVWCDGEMGTRKILTVYWVSHLLLFHVSVHLPPTCQESVGGLNQKQTSTRSNISFLSPVSPKHQLLPSHCSEIDSEIFLQNFKNENSQTINIGLGRNVPVFNELVGFVRKQCLCRIRG